jgi:hypothetical protein
LTWISPKAHPTVGTSPWACCAPKLDTPSIDVEERALLEAQAALRQNARQCVLDGERVLAEDHRLDDAVVCRVLGPPACRSALPAPHAHPLV